MFNTNTLEWVLNFDFHLVSSNILRKGFKEIIQRLSMAIVRGNVASVMGTTGYTEKFNDLFYFNQ